MFFLLLLYISQSACSKKKLLDTRPNNGVFVPANTDDFQGMLDNEVLFGQNFFLTYVSTDEIHIPDGSLGSIAATIKNAYLWNRNIFDTVEPVMDWDLPFAQIVRANEAKAGVVTLKGEDVNRINALLGDAYFKRAFSVFNLAQVFAPPYNAKTAITDLGIPLRLSTDKNEKLYRSTVQATYDQIIADLKVAIPLLPATVDTLHPNRSSQPAAWALLSRVYLSMQDYQQAANAATQCLNLYDSLIDFNQLNSNIAIPFTFRNKETLYQSKLMQGNAFATLFATKGAIVEPELVKSYQDGDLRSAIFFTIKPNGQATLKGSLFGEIYPFSGLCIAEVFLNLAECNARQGYSAAALQYINKLLKNRYTPNRFVEYADTSTSNLLQFILQERKKELVLKGTRWTDLRRLNEDGAGIELKRANQGSFILPPRDARYIFPIPEDVLQFNNYPQNDR